MSRSRPIFLYIEPCHVCITVWNGCFRNVVFSHSLVTTHRDVVRACHHSVVPTTTGWAPSGTAIERSSTPSTAAGQGDGARSQHRSPADCRSRCGRRSSPGTQRPGLRVMVVGALELCLVERSELVRTTRPTDLQPQLVPTLEADPEPVVRRVLGQRKDLAEGVVDERGDRFVVHPSLQRIAVSLGWQLRPAPRGHPQMGTR